MAMNNTYQKQVAANPTALNPQQHYVEQYDAMADLSNQMNNFGQHALELYAKADYIAAENDAKRRFNEREIERDDMKRNIELNRDPRKREAEYMKGLAAIDKKYQRDIDPRFQEDYNSWVDLSDKKALLDLRFNATKDLNKIDRETLAFNVKSAANQTVGANEAYIKMLNAGVENDLARALNRGLISKSEYDKMLLDYGSAKNEANLNNLLVTDPETLSLNLSKNTYGMNEKDLKGWKSKAENALNLNMLRGAATLDAEHRANVNAAFDMIANGKQIPQNLMNNFSEKEQKAFNIRQMYASQGNEVPTNFGTYGYLQNLYTNHPERFKATNLYEYAGELSTKDLSAFVQAQDSIIINQKGKAEINPEVKMETDLMNMAYERMGWKSKEGNYEEKYKFNSLVNEEVNAQMHDKGRLLTTSEKEQIINDMTKKVALRGMFAGEQFVRSVNVDEETPYIEYEQISTSQKNAISQMFLQNQVDLSDFDDDDRQRFYEDMAGALELPKDRQTIAIDKIVREINKKARKMAESGITRAEKAARREKLGERILEVLPDPTMTPYGY